ncbi:MAG TPA: nucleoside monophosphate kinase [Bryobacteraceae bacterium]|nr:nucleoside monophosphate kinase [Bryobacteraceae bacterium]
MKHRTTLTALAVFFAAAAFAENRMVVLLIGPPGAGKTTQARKLSKKYGIPSIALSDLLKKDAGWGKMGSKKIVKAEIESGELANDETADLLMRKRLLLDDARRGFVLDGYPATAGEADKLDALLKERGLPAPVVIYLDVSDDVARERMQRRHRADDTSDMIARRIAEYHHEAEFILGRYQGAQLHKIDGSGDEQHVWHDIEQALAGAGR